MAESITEGTLEQFSKKVGNYVELDEEITTIETDNIDVSVNATEAGTTIELLVNKEDTVTVGQDLAKIESGSEKLALLPKEDAKPEPAAAKELSPASKEAESQPPPPPKEAKSQPSLSKQEPKLSPPKEEKKQSSPPPPPPPKKSKHSCPAISAAIAGPNGGYICIS
jgi:2-oxoglutarate dehydrogenase E2 component (dihydrolipoamide succinyltransferase)